MNNVNEIIIIVGTAIITAFGWFVKLIWGRQEKQALRIEQVEKEIITLESEIEKQGLQREAFHSAQMAEMRIIKEALDKILEKIDKYDRNINEFYQLNKDLINPELKNK